MISILSAACVGRRQPWDFIYKYTSCLAQIKIPTVMTSSVFLQGRKHFSVSFPFVEHAKLGKGWQSSWDIKGLCNPNRIWRRLSPQRILFCWLKSILCVCISRKSFSEIKFPSKDSSLSLSSCRCSADGAMLPTPPPHANTWYLHSSLRLPNEIFSVIIIKHRKRDKAGEEEERNRLWQRKRNWFGLNKLRIHAV